MQTILEALPQEFQEFREIVHTLARLVLQCRLFPSNHPSTQRALSNAFIRLDTALQRKKSVKLTFSGGVISFLNFKLDMKETDDKAVHLLRESLVRHSIGEVEFVKGATKEDIGSLARVMAATGKPNETGADASLCGAMRNIRVRHGAPPAAGRGELPFKDREPRAAEGRPERSASPGAGESKMGLIVKGVLERMEKMRGREGTKAGAKILEVVEREGGDTATILLLNSLREYDDYTFSHSVNVAVIAAAVARSLGFGDEFVDSIARAALLHDIGKLYVPRAIIHKEGRLTPAEWQSVKRHPMDGERILREERLDLLSRRVAYEHHMRHDRLGYPKAKDGYEVHRASEIVRIADSYDALTTKRPYRKQINPYDAIKLMAKGAGSEFHAECFDAFLRVLGNVPIGSVLELDSGETALVVDISEEHDQLPRVRLLTDEAGNERRDAVVLDLNERDPATGDLKRRIVAVVEQSVRDVDVGKYILS